MTGGRNDFLPRDDLSFRRVCYADQGGGNVSPFNKKTADSLVVLLLRQHTYFKIYFLEATAFLFPTLLKHPVVLFALREEYFC